MSCLTSPDTLTTAALALLVAAGKADFDMQAQVTRRRNGKYRFWLTLWDPSATRNPLDCHYCMEWGENMDEVLAKVAKNLGVSWPLPEAASAAPASDTLLSELEERAAAAYPGPYHVHILGDRTRWLMTGSGSDVFRKLESEHDLDALSPYASQQRRATDAYLALAATAAPALLARLRSAGAGVARWIPVIHGKGLPEEIGHYLCLCADGAQLVCFLSAMGNWSVFPGARYYGDLTGNGSPQPDRMVTHWQPLPAAPTAKGGQPNG